MLLFMWMTRSAPPPALARPSPATLAPGGSAARSARRVRGLADRGPPRHRPARAGPQAAERTVEFFAAQIRNPNTRAAYGTAVTRFFTWCDPHGLALTQLSPIAVATYIDEMQGMYRAPTIKQHLGYRHDSPDQCPRSMRASVSAHGLDSNTPREYSFPDARLSRIADCGVGGFRRDASGSGPYGLWWFPAPGHPHSEVRSGRGEPCRRRAVWNLPGRPSRFSH